MKSKLSSIILNQICRLIYFYQYTLSPDHGLFKSLFPNGVCRYTPTCSKYAQQAIKEYGWGGLVLAFRRLLRCHPFSSGGSDPVIFKSTHKL